MKEPPIITKYWNHIESNLDETIQRQSSDNKVGALKTTFTKEQYPRTTNGPHRFISNPNG
jgi:hypothetical protein